MAEGEQRFPDMSRPYDPDLMALAETAALEAGIPLTRGTYGWVGGPHFETPAEVRALRAAGADVVGMSTVPEVIVARAGGTAGACLLGGDERRGGAGRRRHRS